MIIKYYLKLVQLPASLKEKHGIRAEGGRFDAVKTLGEYSPIKELTNNKGQIVAYLTNTTNIVNSTAYYWLKGRKSMNISSIYPLSGTDKHGYIIGYGTPNNNLYYGKERNKNPFFACKNDGFIFRIDKDFQSIELFVLPDSRTNIIAYATQLKEFLYGNILEEISARAETFFDYDKK